MTDRPPADWYPDRRVPGGNQLRYWNGTRWTDHVARRKSPLPAGWMVGGVAVVAVLLALFTGIAIGIAATDDDSRSHGPQVGQEYLEEQVRESDAEHAEATDTAEPVAEENAEPSKEPAVEPTEPTSKPPTLYLVSRVVDGDTLELANGETVRLIGVDTPEAGECGFERARINLIDLAEGQRVRLTRPGGTEDRDRYGRLLRYVDVGSKDAGLRLLENGNAIARYDSRDGYGWHPRERKYVGADRAHQNFQCAPPPSPTPPPQARSNCAAGYSPCIPPYPPDLDCADIGHTVYVTGSDPHGLDADNDGVACEWS